MNAGAAKIGDVVESCTSRVDRPFEPALDRDLVTNRQVGKRETPRQLHLDQLVDCKIVHHLEPEAATVEHSRGALAFYEIAACSNGVPQKPTEPRSVDRLAPL